MTQEGQVLGTPAYMAPEQARGDAPGVDGRADVYSLGVMFYQMLTGELPFRGNTRMLLHQVLHDEPRPPRKLNDQVPRDLETVCLKAMAKGPGRRYPTAGELADDLRRWLEGKPVQARPAGALERLGRWARRNPKLAAASLAAFGLLATAAVSAWFAVYLAQAAAQLARTKDDLELTNGKLSQANGEKDRSNADLERVNGELKHEKDNVEDSLGKVRTTSAEQRRTLIQSARVAYGRGLELCQKGEVQDGMHWLARGLEIAPADADDLQHALRVNLAAWRDQMCAVRDIRSGWGWVQPPDGKHKIHSDASGDQFIEVETGKAVGQFMPWPPGVFQQ
jgi:hypothetical protein